MAATAALCTPHPSAQRSAARRPVWRPLIGFGEHHGLAAAPAAGDLAQHDRGLEDIARTAHGVHPCEFGLDRPAARVTCPRGHRLEHFFCDTHGVARGLSYAGPSSRAGGREPGFPAAAARVTSVRSGAKQPR